MCFCGVPGGCLLVFSKYMHTHITWVLLGRCNPHDPVMPRLDVSDRVAAGLSVADPERRRDRVFFFLHWLLHPPVARYPLTGAVATLPVLLYSTWGVCPLGVVFGSGGPCGVG